jgi:hypothetical protein
VTYFGWAVAVEAERTPARIGVQSTDVFVHALKLAVLVQSGAQRLVGKCRKPAACSRQALTHHPRVARADRLCRFFLHGPGYRSRAPHAADLLHLRGRC